MKRPTRDRVKLKMVRLKGLDFGLSLTLLIEILSLTLDAWSEILPSSEQWPKIWPVMRRS